MSAGVLATLLLILCAHAQAQSDSHSQKFDFDIPRTTRVMALRELSRQADGLLLGYLSNDTAEEQELVGPIKGQHTVEDALRVIVQSSKLTFRWVEQNMVSVEPSRVVRAAPERDNVPTRTPSRSAGPEPAILQLREEVTVTSSLVGALVDEIRPAVVQDSNRLDAIGAPTLAEALKYISQSAYSRPEGYRASGAQYAEMRGLGADVALVLINGRRTLPSASSLSSSAFDLNTLPITAVERVEFLLDSAATPYGTDAIGGVINIVLVQKVPEPVVEVRYGEAAGGAEQHRFTFSGGVNKEKFHAALVFDYIDLDGLLGADRDRWSNQDFRRFGSFDRRSRISSPGNISSLIGNTPDDPTRGNLPGLPSTFAAVPLVDATPGVSREDFLATAGQAGLESLLKYSSVVPEATRLSTSATASLDVTDDITASAELLYVDRDSTYYFSSPVLPGLPVMASNAFNPFGVPVLTQRLLTEYGSQYQFVESDMVRAVATLHGGGGEWDWELAAVHSDEEASTWTHHVLDMPKVLQALASPDPTLALNPFQNRPVGTPELLASLLAPRVVSEFASAGTQLSGYLQGPIWALPAGPLSTMVGGEWRNEAAMFNNPQGGSYDRNRDVTAGFAQLRIPLVSEAMQWPGVNELLLTTGTRLDQYSDGDRIDRSQVGLLWKPHRNFSVRASGGSSFRPPSLHDLYFPATTTIARVNDPARGNELANITLTMGGNTTLRPTTARSFTSGMMFSPDSPLNWKFSADYWRVTMSDRVVSLSLPLLLANEDRFASRVVRAPRTDADVQAGLPGALRSLDSSRINAGRVTTSGVDVAIRADVQTDFGRITPELLATWFDEYRSTEIPGGPEVDRVDLASDLGSILQWRAIFSLGWKRGPYGATLFARYTPSYDDSIAGQRNLRKIESQTLLDLHGSVDLGKLLPAPMWNGFKVTLGGMNIFNEAPGFAEVGDAAGYDQSQADLKQRSYYLRLEKKF
jgi:iron complex outermembrane receptor protein